MDTNVEKEEIVDAEFKDAARPSFTNYAFIVERPSDSDTPIAGVIQFRNQTELNKKLNAARNPQIIKVVRGYPLETKVETQIRLM